MEGRHLNFYNSASAPSGMTHTWYATGIFLLWQATPVWKSKWIATGYECVIHHSYGTC